MPLGQANHAALAGPFSLVTPRDHPQVGYLELYGTGKLVTSADKVRDMAHRYGSIRAQALNFRDSRRLIEQIWRSA